MEFSERPWPKFNSYKNFVSLNRPFLGDILLHYVEHEQNNLVTQPHLFIYLCYRFFFSSSPKININFLRRRTVTSTFMWGYRLYVNCVDLVVKRIIRLQ